MTNHPPPDRPALSGTYHGLAVSIGDGGLVVEGIEDLEAVQREYAEWRDPELRDYRPDHDRMQERAIGALPECDCEAWSWLLETRDRDDVEAALAKQAEDAEYDVRAGFQ